MKRLGVLLLSFGVIALPALASAAPKIATLPSPDGKVTITVTSDPSLGSPSYTVKCGEKTVIADSPLGIRLAEDEGDFTADLRLIGKSRVVAVDETYELTQGKQTVCRDHHHEMGLLFENAEGRQMELLLRAFDDGVAFRYRLPEKSQQAYRVTGEATGFHVPDGAKFWAQPYDKISKYTPAYEKFYADGEPVGVEAPLGQGWAFPFLFELEDGPWVLLTEAGSCEGYCACRLANEEGDSTYTIRFPDPGEGNDVGLVEPESTLPLATPWRTILVSEDLAGIVESTLVTSLNPPSKIDDASWIRPGKASWSWLSDHDSPQDAAKLKRFVDLSAEMGWDYTLIDANWNMMHGGTVHDVIAYAKQKGVGPLLWLNGGGPHNTVTEAPRDKMYEDDVRRRTFAELQKWGVEGVKVDFFQSDKQTTIALYHEILRDAAAHHMLVNFHGCTLPRGWSRTWPNLMTMEAVFGAEAYSFNAGYPEGATKHNTILPFTRNVVGPMDYTPVMFFDNEYPHKTTSAHELALSVVYQSGILHFADSVEGIRAQPEAVKDFLRRVPVVWDETRLLEGYPGRYVVIARRCGDTWWIGGLNSLDVGATVDFPLDFLGDGAYAMRVISDGDGPRAFKVSDRDVTTSETCRVELLPYGGFMAELKPAK